MRSLAIGGLFRDFGQLHVEALLHHRRGHHEDDEQHEHHVDERHDVDLRQHASTRGRDAPATGAFSGIDRLQLRHAASAEVPLGDVQELEREVVHLRRQELHARCEVVVEIDGGNGREEAGSGRDERVGDAGRDDARGSSIRSARFPETPP